MKNFQSRSNVSTTYPYLYTTLQSPTNATSEFLSITVVSVGVFLTTCASYIFLAVIYHAVKLYTLKEEITEFQRNYSVKKTQSKANALSKALGYLSIAAATLACLNCASDHSLIYLRETSDFTCKFVEGLTFLFYSLGVITVYTFLWLRQRVFYGTPSLKEMHSKYMRRISGAILPVFGTIMAVGLVCTIALWNFETSTRGCIETSQSRVPMIVLFLGSVSMQAALLGLFVFPLKQHSSFTKISSASSDALMAALIRRTFAITAICISADLIAFIIVMTLPRSIPFIAINLTYDGNLIVNVICIVCSFVDWRSRLGLCCAPEIPLEENFRRNASERESQIRLKRQPTSSHSESQHNEAQVFLT